MRGIHDDDESGAHLLELAFFLGLWRLGVALLEGSEFGVWGFEIWSLGSRVSGRGLRVDGGGCSV